MVDMACSFFTLFVVFVVSSWLVSDATGDLDSMRFANYYGDHMVLQRAPVSAVVWGYVQSCDSTISVDLDGKKVTATQTSAGASGCRWKASLPVTPAGGPHKVTASSDKYGSAMLSDVLFGDVWICSGQSNMQFTVPQAFNASEEIQKAANYPNIRVFTAQLVSSDTETDELLGIMQKWAQASPDSINGSSWGYFSATCWFFGKNLYDSIQIPIGLLATSWGGTRVEAWSSPDALAKCSSREEHHGKKRSVGPNPNNPSVLWNSMIHPFLQMPIYGAVWYQGEANAGDAAKYTCTFPAMIDDWRMKWHDATLGQTNFVFPFGFVQLAPTGKDNHTSTGFPDLRWAQTAAKGWVPNSRMDMVFMAVATDLGDPTSPFGSIHPRDKEDVGWRLALGALAIAYGNKTANMIYYSVPIPSKAVMSNVGKADMVVSAEIKYQMIAEALTMRSPYGFEIGCSKSTTDRKWVEGTLKHTDGTSMALVEFPQCPEGYQPFAVRYCWREDPCSFKQCPLYGGPAMLPAPPYLIDVEIE